MTTETTEMTLENVAMLKLTSGEEVLTLVTAMKDVSFEIKFPVTITKRMKGVEEIHDIQPWCEWSKTREFEVPLTSIMFVDSPIDDMAQFYFDLVFPKPVEEKTKLEEMRSSANNANAIEKPQILLPGGHGKKIVKPSNLEVVK